MYNYHEGEGLIEERDWLLSIWQTLREFNMEYGGVIHQYTPHIYVSGVMFRPESLLMKTYAPMFAEHFKYRDHKALLADLAPDQEEIWTAHCVSASFSPDGARLLVAYDTGFVHIVRGEAA